MIRSLRRNVAKNKIRQVSLHKSCSHQGIRGLGSKKTLHRDRHSGQRSYFAAHWRDFI